MKRKKIIYLVSAVIIFSANIGFAQRELERQEILDILASLTTQPQTTWLNYGSIEAIHQEYHGPEITDPNVLGQKIAQAQRAYLAKPSLTERTENLRRLKYNAIPFNLRYKYTNEYTMTSRVMVKYDGERFCWEIDTLARNDSLLSANPPPLSQYFNLEWNARRVFAWDGINYTTYFQPGNHAIVKEADVNMSIAVNGPLTAGFIPWGYGIYRYEPLAAARLIGLETEAAGQPVINLTVIRPEPPEMFFVLDPACDYAVRFYTLTFADGRSVWQTYENYQHIANRWVPRIITIESFKNDEDSLQLTDRDIWHFTEINAEPLDPVEFKVNYDMDAIVEYYSAVTTAPLMYRYSHKSLAPHGVDTDSLLVDRLITALAPEDSPKNCATVAVKYMAQQLGRDISDQQLAGLIDEPNNSSSLYAIQELVRDWGFYCRAVRADLDTLQQNSHYPMLLFLPRDHHYVVLGNLDDQYIRLIDLINHDFFYRLERAAITQDQKEFSVLILSNEPIQLTGSFSEIDAAQLHRIIGRDDCPFGCYSCTELLQDYDVIYCSEPVGGLCGGTYQEYFRRYGCTLDTAGYCRGTGMLGSRELCCVIDPYTLEDCITTGEWICYYLRACGSGN